MQTDVARLSQKSRVGTGALPFFYDGTLPNLWQLTDISGMAQRFQSHFRLRYPEQRLRVSGCVIEKLYYRPERNCKVLYRLQLQEKSGQQTEQWFFAQMYSAEKSFAKFNRAQEKATTPVSFWEPVSFWPEIDTILWTFPHDPQLRQLPTLIQPETMVKLLATYLPTKQLCSNISYRHLKMMPGKRCLLQFTAGNDAFSFVTKSYGRLPQSAAKGVYAHKIFTDVYAATQHNEWLTVPKPLFYDSGLTTYAQEMCLGEPPAPTASTHTIQQAAKALAEFHLLTDLPQLEASKRTADLVERVQKGAALVSNFLPYEQRVWSLANRLTVVAAALTGAAPQQTPIHGAFRLNQLLGQNGRFALLDLDDAGWGDPHLDIAECVASLLMEHFTANLPLATLEANAETFVLAYAESVPWFPEAARLHGYIALALFQKLAGAFQRLETAVFPKLEQLFNLIEHHLEQAV